MDVVRYYESVMAAKHVQIDAIPLPNMSTGMWICEGNVLCLLRSYSKIKVGP